MKAVMLLAPGLLEVALLAALALLIALFLPLSPLLLAMLLGMLRGNLLRPSWQDAGQAGVNFSKKSILRTAIVFYGFHLNLQAMRDLGAAPLLLDALMLGSTFLLAVLLGKRFLRLDRDSSILMGAGASICGAAAVLGAQGVIKADESKVSLAVATVVLFGTASLLLLPSLYALGWIPFPPAIFGLYVGASVHEVAQVVAIGGIFGEPVASLAILSKMVRVLLLVPFLWLLAYALSRSRAQRVPFPYFALGFLAMAALNALTPDGAWKRFIVQADLFLLSMAMAALGLSTHFASMKRFGWRPFLLAGLLWLWLLLGGGVLAWMLLC